jgi:integrase
MLTDLKISSAKHGEKAYKLADGLGLHLFVSPTAKLWRFRYSFAGKEKLLSLGIYPDVSLAKAREKRDDARKLLADGKDPAVQKQLDKIAAATSSGNTFGAIAEEYLDRLKADGKAESTIEKNRWLLLDLAAPLAKRPITEVTSAEILAILKRIEATGRRDTARRLRGTIGSLYRFAIANLKAQSDPTYALRGALLQPEVTHRPAITDEKKLGALMVSIDEYDGWPTLKAALQLIALTMARPGEIRLMRRSEINWPAAKWSIPGERMKMRVPHDVPLSRQALDVLRSVWELSSGDGLVFPSIRSTVKPLSENAMNSALRRMGFSQNEMTAHGFRSSASTILNERGFDDDVIEAALAHQDENEVRRAYNRAKYWPERVKLLQDWSDLLDQFKAKSASHGTA